MKRQPFDQTIKLRGLIVLGIVVLGIWSLKAFAQATPTNGARAADPALLVGPDAQGSACLQVEGLTFTISGPETLLATRGSDSIALIHTTMFLPAGLHEMRFLASELCPGGPKAHFVVNHYLHTVQELRFFGGQSRERIAVIGPTGRSASVPGGAVASVQTAATR
jgi:hypothetical protein